MDPVVFAALGDPNRLRILRLLDEAPRPVGEVASALGLRQPQTTKHLHTLQRAGLVTVTPLGQRRIYAVRRGAFAQLRDGLKPLARERPAERTLARYAAAVAAEEALALTDPNWAIGRTLTLRRTLPAPAETVFAHWTDAALIRTWWHPEHFSVAAAEADPRPGGVLRVVLEEGDGTRHESAGRYEAVDPPRALRFIQSPLDAEGRPLLTVTADVSVRERNRSTDLTLRLRVTDARPEAAPALAGMQPGWEQLMDALAERLASSQPGCVGDS